MFNFKINSQKNPRNRPHEGTKSSGTRSVFCNCFLGALSSNRLNGAELGSPAVVLDRARDERKAKTEEIEPEIVGALVPECDEALSV